MLCFPNAKINIGLNILERRPDSFHNIETLFYPVPLSDILEIIVDEDGGVSKVELNITGLNVPGEKENNLCSKAYKILSEDFPLPSVKIYLHKLIPMGAGLGGGSSDGAYTLVLLNKIFQLGLEPGRLKTYAARLGSDCTFFIDNKAAIGIEKGDVLKDVNINLRGHYLVIVKPGVSIPTPEAYAGVKPFITETPLIYLIKLPIRQWKEKIVNDFEKTVFTTYPKIKEIKDRLYLEGALYASMTGSGSAVYGIFEEEKLLKECFPGMFYWGGQINK